jgi:hypothetical protein
MPVQLPLGAPFQFFERLGQLLLHLFERTLPPQDFALFSGRIPCQ